MEPSLLRLFAFICFVFHQADSFTIVLPDSDASSAPRDGLAAGYNVIYTDSKEQEAVYDIMKATGNDWATDIPDVCRGRWHGIECMPDKDNVYHVVSLSFGALSDDTAFPTCDPTRAHLSYSITKLPHLRTLFFYRCFTSNPQPIPAFLGQLGSTLQTLVLRENGHVGPIPGEVGNLTRLRVLDLHMNNLNGSIPVDMNRMSGLKSLDLSSNRINGPIPSGLFTFPALSMLDLNQNLLTGPIPDNIGSCRALLKLDLGRNRLTGAIPNSIGDLSNLILMDLSYNRLVGAIPASVSNMGALQALILKGNPMGPQMFAPDIEKNGFDGLERSLTVLVASGMNLRGPMPEALARLSNLRVLHLDKNMLRGPIPGGLRNLTSLSELRLNDNQLTGPVPFGREMVWRMKRKLRLHNNSGLCFDPSSWLEVEGKDWTDNIGREIGPCDTMGPGPSMEDRHVSGVEWKGGGSR